MRTEPTARYDTEPANSRTSWNVTFQEQYTEFMACGSSMAHHALIFHHLLDSAAAREGCHWAGLKIMPSSFPTMQKLIWDTFATYNSDLLICWHKDRAQLESPPARTDPSLRKGWAGVVTQLGSSKNSCWTMLEYGAKHKKKGLLSASNFYIYLCSHILIQILWHKLCFIKLLLICCFNIGSWFVCWYPPNKA